MQHQVLVTREPLHSASAVDGKPSRTSRSLFEHPDFAWDKPFGELF